MIPAIGSALPRVDMSRVQGTPSVGSNFGSAATGQPDFASVMSKVAGDAITTMKTAETTSVQGINGTASAQAVVDAVMSAERTLTSAVAIRDKVVAAYQELSRMAI